MNPNDAQNLAPQTVPAALRLDIEITDPETIAALIHHADGRDRNEFTRQALKIGVIALRHAQGQIDVDAVRREGERLVKDLAGALDGHKSTTEATMVAALKTYFDPSDGRFTERVERLVKKDGELERVMQQQLGNAKQQIEGLLAQFTGADSGLAKLLTPDESNRFITALRANIEVTLEAQSSRVLREFSLDNADSALARFLRELSQKHGELTGDLRTLIESASKEFSLDQEDSALSRLVKRVQDAHTKISAEFSLDNQESALARMKRELVELFEAQQRQADDFQAHVKSALESMQIRREEAARSTIHGDIFEETIVVEVMRRASDAGDIAEAVGNLVGNVPRSKVGDLVITLGPDSAAAGARIVVEAKEDASYTLKSTLDEIDTARKNRAAQIGLFIHSRKTAPASMKPLTRYGDDVIIIWDVEDERSDVVLEAGLAVAKALCARAATTSAQTTADLQEMAKALNGIEQQIEKLADIRTKTTTIKSATESIYSTTETMEKDLRRRLDVLRDVASAFMAVSVSENAL